MRANTTKIHIVGYFGYQTNQLDGQTIKTRSIRELVEQKCGRVWFSDTQRLRLNPLSGVKMLFDVACCKTLILIPAHNNLTYIFPILYLLSVLCRFKIVYIAVGGWLYEYCKEHHFVGWLLRKVSVVLLENRSVITSLRDSLGFANVEYLHNYRMGEYAPSFSVSQNSEPLKIVFMARIHRMKGIDTVFEIAEHYAQNTLKPISIDFYGQINESNREHFLKSVATYDFVSYHGELAPSLISETLGCYDIMILPTRYHTEGFPGSILDAYISGIPVLVSNWKYAQEFVDVDFNGFICSVDKTDEFVGVIDKLIANRELLLHMKHNAHESSCQYSSAAAWEIIKHYLM